MIVVMVATSWPGLHSGVAILNFLELVALIPEQSSLATIVSVDHIKSIT